MDFDLSDDQRDLRDGIRNLLGGALPIARVREGFDRTMWDELVGAGVFGLLADGFTWSDAAVVFEELGRAVVPGPLVWGLLAHDPAHPARVVGGLERPDAGTPATVEHLADLDLLVVLDADGIDEVDPAGVVGQLVERPLDPLTPVTRVAALPAGTHVADAAVAGEWRRRGAVLTAAYAVGMADACTALSVAYAKEREQFSRPIGSFQAVKHLCADMAVRVEVARAATHAAAVHLDDPGLGGTDRAVSGAKLLAGEAAVANGRSATQVHGGMGFTWEVDVHLFLKRAWVLDTTFGSGDHHADRVRRLLLAVTDHEAPGESGWQPLLDDLDARRTEARGMGGAERLERQHERGRLDARQRVERLLDPGSFVELGALTGSVQRGVSPIAPADALVAGHGTVDGRPVLVGAEDFTVMGGSIGLATGSKRFRLVQLAEQERVPLVMLLEGAGDRAQNVFERRGRAPNDLQALVSLSGLVPTVCVVMGPSAGHGALTAPLMDLVVMVEGAALFSAGPPLVQAAVGEEVTKEELGGTPVHTVVSGVAHNAAPDDAAALDLVRRYLSYLPSNAWEHPPAVASDTTAADTGPRRLDGLLDLIPADPRRAYDVRSVVELVCDSGSVLEIAPAFGRAVTTALARLGGLALAVVANQPAVKAGSIDSDAADKAAHFLAVADAFHLPVVFLADNPGVLAGSVSERSGILRHAARMFAAQARVTSPKLHVTLRKAYGFGSSLMGMNPFDGQTVALALPGARLGAMPADSGAEAAKLESDARMVLVNAEVGGAYSAADTMSYDDVVDPRDLRDHLLAALRLGAARRAGPVTPVQHRGIAP